jgi:hypothetical protein
MFRRGRTTAHKVEAAKSPSLSAVAAASISSLDHVKIPSAGRKLRPPPPPRLFVSFLRKALGNELRSGHPSRGFLVRSTRQEVLNLPGLNRISPRSGAFVRSFGEEAAPRTRDSCQR